MGNLAARLADLWRGLFDALVRDNKILPPVLALLALLLFAWVVAGAFVSDPDEEGSSSGTAELVQSRDPAAGADPPEVEDRDADSYAAYRNKDPFRQLLAPASEDTSEDTSGSAPDGDTTTPSASVPPEDTGGGGQGGGTDDTGNGNGGGNNGGNGGGEASRKDTDGDGITNRREEALGLDPRDPDSDGDGIDDGKDDADGDGVPDGQQGGGGGAGGGGGGGGGGNRGGGGGAGNGGGAGDDELFDSGGYVP